MNKLYKRICIVLIGIIIVFVAFLIIFNLFTSKKVETFNLSHSENEIVDSNVSDTNKSNIESLEPKSYSAVIPIYMYHWIKEDTGGYEYPEMMVKTSEIKKQFEYLSTNGYDTIFITDLKKVYNLKKPVALTFDDGWQDVYNNVFPYAKEYKVKISMYVIEDLVGTPGYCTIEQLKEMKESGLVDIQSHTVTHRKLAEISNNDAYKELLDSKEYLKNELDINSTVICYPSGSFNNSVIKSAKEIGYEYGLAMDGGIYYTDKADEMSIPRIFATRSMSLETFISYASKSSVEVKWE